MSFANTIAGWFSLGNAVDQSSFRNWGLEVESKVNALDKMTTKGDLLGYSSAVTRVAVGTDGQVLIADSTQAAGVKWGASVTTLTTKGDLLGYASGLVRVAVGTNGQVLTADSTQAAGVKWAASHPLTTKGDVFVYSTQAARLAVGTDGQVLTADSTQAAGVKWATPEASKLAQRVNATLATVATGTTTIPADDTIPQSSEGDQYITVSITPTNASSTLVVEAELYVASSISSASIVAALFRDSGANAVAVSRIYLSLIGAMDVVRVVAIVSAASTSASTFKVRAGLTAAGTLTVNGAAGARMFGGVMTSYISVSEYLP